MATEKSALPQTVSFDEEKQALVIIDQSLLPNKTEMLYLKTEEQVHRAIYLLKVRGAPAIGVAAGYGLYLAALNIETDDHAEFVQKLAASRDYLAGARPTAVNLSWALKRVFSVTEQNPTAEVDELRLLIKKKADEILAEDIMMCRQIGEYGLSLLKDNWGILTHCNAGQLAAVKYGTALAPLHLGRERGMNFCVYADETRPQLSQHAIAQLEVQIKYEGYIQKQQQQIMRYQKLEHKKLDEALDYKSLEGLRKEAVQKLSQIRPTSIGQASRISGVSPADINVLLIHLEKMRRGKA